MRLAGLVVCAILLAGCAGNPHRPVAPSNPIEPLPSVTPEQAAFGDRGPAVSTTVWHEERVAPIGLDSWSRDVPLESFGVQAVLDEWGRPVPAYVYRYSPVGGNFTGYPTAAKMQAQPSGEARAIEYHFAAADGRLLSVTDPASTRTRFADPRLPLPWVSGYEAHLLFAVTFAARGGDFSAPLQLAFDTLVIQPSENRPLPGDCRVLEVTSGSGDAPGPLAPEDVSRLVCVQDDGSPLWAYFGFEGDSLALTRQSAPPIPPILFGDVKPQPDHPRDGWQETSLSLGVAPPILMPASSYPGDWANALREVARAVDTFPTYSSWAGEQSGSFLAQAFRHEPASATFLPGLPPFGPLDWRSFAFVATDSGVWGASIQSRYADPEGADVHISDIGGASDARFPHPAIVRIGDVQAALEDLVPERADYIHFIVFPSTMWPSDADDAAWWEPSTLPGSVGNRRELLARRDSRNDGAHQRDHRPVA
jgi:hypothetical protein